MKFGLFSSLPSNALGETNMFISKKGNGFNSKNTVANKDADGHVIIGPRNFTTKPVRMGGHKDWQVLSKPEYVSIGDMYKPA
jgi:hypothetical protein